MSWSFFVPLSALILFLFFVAKTIKNEGLKKGSGKYVNFFGLNFQIPSWWRAHQENQKIILTSHPKMEAKASNHWHGSIEKFDHRHFSSAEEILRELEQEGYILDEDSLVIKSNGQECSVEGTSTYREEERFYIKLVERRHPLNPCILRFWSKSAILHGVLEGPYFDKMTKQLDTISGADIDSGYKNEVSE